MKDLRDVNVKLKKPQPRDQQLTVTVIVTWLNGLCELRRI